MKQQSTYSPSLQEGISSSEMVELFYGHAQDPAYTETVGLYNIPLSYLCTVNSKVNNASVFSLLRMAFGR